MDIAPLGFYVDTSGLITGQKAADEFVVSVGKAADAADKLGAKSKQAGVDAQQAASGMSRAGSEAQQAASKTDQLANKTATASSRFQDFITKLQSARSGMQGSSKEADGFLGKLGSLNTNFSSATDKANEMAQALGIQGANFGLQGALGGAAGGAGRLGSALMAVGRTIGPVGIAVASLTAGFVAMQVSLADNQDRWASYRQRLGVALKDFDEASASVGRLSDIANNVGVSMDAVMQSFQRFANVRNSIGATTEELEEMTQAIVQIGIVSGTSQGEMQGAMLQFSQALAAGRLNGDELRSIMESMQPLLQEIAAGMNVSVGELRKMGAEGELTSDRIFKALMSRTDEIEERFEQIGGTAAQSQTRMANQWDELMANVGEFTGASQTVQATYDGIAATLERINDLLGESPDNAENLNRRVQAKIEAAQTAQRLPGLTSKFAAAAFLYSAKSDVDAARATEDEPINEMEQMLANTEQLASKVKGLTGEWAKGLGQLTKMETASANLADQMAAAVELEAQANRELARAQQELAAKGRELTVLQALADAGDETAAKALSDARERLTEAENSLRSAIDAQGDLTLAQENLERRIADARTGGLAKLRRETERMNAAMLEGAGGMVALYTQAAEMAQRAKESGGTTTVDDALAGLIANARAKATGRIADLNYSAGIQEQLATDLLGGEADMEAEARAEALSWAFNQFGSALSDNMDVVNDYTDALMRMKAAQQQVADAAELDAIERSIRGLEAGTAAIGLGGYAERQAAFAQRQAEFREERSQMGQSLANVTTPTASAGTLDQYVRLIETLFPGARITSTNRPGSRTSSGRTSDHAVGRAIDFVPAGGMANSDPEQVLRTLQAAGVPIRSNDAGTRQFFGPGRFNVDGKHGNHYHVGLNLGQQAGMGSQAFDSTAFATSTDRIANAREREFSAQERQRFQRFSVTSMQGIEDNEARARVAGNAELERQLELELKIRDAKLDYAPELRDYVDAVMRAADAAEREAMAAKETAQARRGNDERARRLEKLGDPAALRQLELELQIERIRENVPAGQQDAAIAEARRGFELDTEETLARAKADRDERIRSMQQQAELARYFGDELEVQEAIMRRQNELRRAGIEIGSEEMQAALEMEEALTRQEVLFRRQLDRHLAIRDAFLGAADDIGEGFTKMFSYAFREGEIKANFALRAIELAFYNMLDRIVQQLVISPLVDAIGQIFGMAFGSIFGAGPTLPGSGGLGGGIGIGGGFSGGISGGMALGGVVPAASGMIVNTPTRTHGGRYLTGEGPGLYEAILPLRRGSDGKLGVAAGGGGGGSQRVAVNIIDQRGERAEAVEVQERETGDGMREIDVLIRDAVAGHISKGSFDTANRSSYGINRAVQRR